MADSNKIHPAITFKNIKNFIPITMEMDKSQYETNPTRTPHPKNWAQHDAILTQWIYSTICKELLLTILKPDQTAQQAWDRVKSIFQDNEKSRAIHFNTDFLTSDWRTSPTYHPTVRN
ncbi:uncharacterized protein [Rutidosis leptorrhynchoides]|uniref:uncharacterized protein n=1 Tax=Rutidosis leptorrhynchoides TaxID=125765 RepID=UPI003A999FAC